MSSRKISQVDARRFRKERDEARERVNGLLRRGARTYGGTHIGGEIGITGASMDRLRTAKQLGYAVFVAVHDSENRIDFRAMKPGEA